MFRVGPVSRAERYLVLHDMAEIGRILACAEFERIICEIGTSFPLWSQMYMGGLFPTYSDASVETTVMHEEAALRVCAQRIVWRILSLEIKRKEGGKSHQQQT